MTRSHGLKFAPGSQGASWQLRTSEPTATAATTTGMVFQSCCRGLAHALQRELKRSASEPGRHGTPSFIGSPRFRRHASPVLRPGTHPLDAIQSRNVLWPPFSKHRNGFLKGTSGALGSHDGQTISRHPFSVMIHMSVSGSDHSAGRAGRYSGCTSLRLSRVQ